MHRMCKIIHTDFKPENVVINLRDDEVIEIAKTGQLTTTKMYEHQEIIKKINMKIAGTLPAQEAPLEEEEEKEEPHANNDGLTAKQRKNQKKKEQRKRKKQQGKEEEAKPEPAEPDL